MPTFYPSSALYLNPAWIFPKEATEAAGRAAFLSTSTDRQVMLVDDQHAFRERVADALGGAGVRVLQASGVYDATRLARGRELDLLVVAGQQRQQSGWLCAGKLCGQPPWTDVILHFGCVSRRDRLWAGVSEIAALVETRGHVEPLVGAILRQLRRRSPADIGRAVA